MSKKQLEHHLFSVLTLIAIFVSVCLLTFDKIYGFRNFAESAYDFGMHAQAAWKFAFSQDQFVTLRGMNYLGDHLWFIIYPVSWIYRIWSNPEVLFFIQSLFLAGAAWPLFLISRELKLTNFTAFVVALSWLLHPALVNMASDSFHPEVIAAFFLVWSLFFYLRNQWGLFILSLVFAALCKEDVALTIGALLLVAAWKKKSLKIFAGAVLTGFWFLFSLYWLLPKMNGYGFFRMEDGYWFEDLKNNYLNFDFYQEVFWNPQVGNYILFLFGPVLFLSLRNPLWLLPFVPSFAINLLSKIDYLRSVDYHYNNQTLPFIFFAMILALARLSRPWLQKPATITMLIAGIAFHIAGSRPHYQLKLERALSEKMNLKSPKMASLEKISETYLKGNHVIASSHNLTPLLSQRDFIFMYPNPFRQKLYGIREQDPVPVKHVDFVLLDKRYQEEKLHLKKMKLVYQDEWFELFQGPQEIVGSPSKSKL